MENAPKVIDGRPVLIQVSDAIFKSGLFPNVKNSFGAFAIVQYGAELGIGPMTSLQTMAIVQGKICMGAQMMLSLAIKAGVSYKIIQSTNEIAVIEFKGDTEYTSAFGITDAKTAGIWKAQSGWEKYPKDMCFWRAVTQGIRRVKPGVVLGLYAIEELQDAPALDAVTVPENAKPPEPEKPRQDFDFLKKCGEAKKQLKALTGDDSAYYETLAAWTYAHANIVGEEDRIGVLNDLREKYKAVKAEIAAKGG